MVSCSWHGKCRNTDRLCGDCKWNSENKLVDNLVLETEDGKTIRYLEQVN